MGVMKIVLDLVTCPRCSQDHQILVGEFTNPIIFLGDVTITHWAFCENWDEPILITRIDSGEGTVAFWRFR